jgi:ABC-type transport system substrate-binding protein
VRAALTLAALAAPLAAGGALGPRYGGALRVGVLELPLPAPAFCRSADERLLSGLLHETLVQAGPEGHPLPALAAGWTSAASRREWTLQVRDGAAFHDGAPVTADDAVRSLRRFLRSPSPAADQLAQSLAGGAAFRARATEDLPGLEGRPPRAVVLRLEQARALPLAPLAAAAAAVTGPGGAGAGPFAPAAVITGRRAGFVAAAMHVRGRPYVDRVELTAVPETALAGELSSGRIDLAPGGREGPLAAVLLLAVDSTRPPFDRAGARAAVAASVDRANLVRHLLPGGEPGESLLPVPLLAPLPGSPGRAASTLRAAVTLAVSREVPSMVSQRVVAHLADLGLQVTVEARAPSRVLEGPPATLRLWIWSPEVPEAGLALRELARMGPRLTAVDEALAAAEAAPDLDQRRAAHYRAEAALRATHAVVPLAAVPASYRAAARLRGVRVDLAGRVRVEDAWWEP